MTQRKGVGGGLKYNSITLDLINQNFDPLNQEMARQS